MATLRGGTKVCASPEKLASSSTMQVRIVTSTKRAIIAAPTATVTAVAVTVAVAVAIAAVLGVRYLSRYTFYVPIWKEVERFYERSKALEEEAKLREMFAQAVVVK
uniref:Uncharacterized protein n=1 Tax=Vespula pensylvanica TaxID=30213 RepID=A0A834NZS3_VESPE|nr:hypothetical protein H0235_008396 [Vespula pensylvanica]